MTKYTIEAILCSYWWRNNSIYGNPSYNLFFEDNSGNYKRGHTASNSMAGYCIKNFKEGQCV